MKLKRISAIVLALAMTASVAAFAAESETPDVVVDESVVRDVNHDQGDISLLSAPATGGFGGGFGGLLIPVSTTPANYATTITVNGNALEEYSFEKPIPGSWEYKTVTTRLADLPTVPAGYVPVRAIASADPDCYVDWFEESNKGRIVLMPHTIMVSFDDMSVTVDGELLEGVEAQLLNGTTFLPISVIDDLDGYSVVDTSEGGVESYAITTPNGAPIRLMAEEIREAANMGMGMKMSMAELFDFYGESYGFSAEMISECIAYFPVTLNANTLILAKLTDESQKDAFQAACEAYQEYSLSQATFGYMLDARPAIENAQIVFEGDWALFLICNGAEEGVTQFYASLEAMAE